MDRRPIIINMNNTVKTKNNLYYKKVIYHKKKITNSYSTNKKNNINNIHEIRINTLLNNLTQNNVNIKEFRNKNDNNNSFNSIKYKTLNNRKFTQNIFWTNNKINSIIIIQKFIRGFFIRKKIKNNDRNNKILVKTANPNRVKKKLNINILEAIKRNSKNQKSNIKQANNRFKMRNTVNNEDNQNFVFKKNMIYINKEVSRNKNYSFDYKKNEENISKQNIDKELFNDNNNKNLDVNYYTIKKSEKNKISNQDSELSFSNLTNEQFPQNIQTITLGENDTFGNNDKLKKDINYNNNELLENKIINKTQENFNPNNNKSNIFFKDKRNIKLTECKNPSLLSTFQTKENSASERNFNVENINNNFLLDNGQKTERILNTELNENNNKDKKENNNLDTSIDYYIKDEFETDDVYQKNKTNFNLINTNIKYNFNPMVNTNFNKNRTINTSKTANNTFHFQGKFINDINYQKKDELKINNIFESIKEEKPTDIDNDLKSSFYDEDEFVIINYDYSLNEKKIDNTFKISTSENINITGKLPKKVELLNTIKKVIHKSVNIFVFNFFKKLKINEENDNDNDNDKSMTMNDSCSYIPQSRIQKNKIIFNYAQIDLKHNNNIVYNSNKNLLKYKTSNNSNEALEEIEIFKNRNFYSP